MAGPNASKKRNGTRSACSYCGKRHRKGKKNDSCRRGSALLKDADKPKTHEEEEFVDATTRGKPGGNSAVAVARRKRAAERETIRAKRSDKEQLDLVVKRGHPNCSEANRLRLKITLDAQEAAAKLEKKQKKAEAKKK